MILKVKKNFLSYILIIRKQFYLIVSGLKIIGHGNPDNNLESPCIYTHVDMHTYRRVQLENWDVWRNTVDTLRWTNQKLNGDSWMDWWVDDMGSNLLLLF
jgi:hypothetical protein